MFNTHLLTMDEVWYVRGHPLNIACIKTKKLVLETEALEEALVQKRKELDRQVDIMNKRRGDKL